MKILLIRLRLIGDVVFTTPLIRALRRRWPEAHLAYLVEPHAAPVVADNPHLDEVIVATRPHAARRLAEDVSLWRRLRSARYDLVIDLHGGPRSAALARLTGAPRRIGYTVPGRSWLYTERVARTRALRPRHSVLNQWDLLEPLGLGAPDVERDGTEMVVSPAAVASVASKLAAVRIDAAREPVVVVHVSAGNPFRRWPAVSFVALVVALVRRMAKCRVIVVSGPSELEAERQVGAQARAALGPAGTAVVEGLEFDLAELRALADVAALFIGGDSGPLHVAGTTGVPIVGLYGPTLAARSAPWRSAKYATESLEMEQLGCRPCDQRRCDHGDFRCLGLISPMTVADAAARALVSGLVSRRPVS